MRISGVSEVLLWLLLVREERSPGSRRVSCKCAEDTAVGVRWRGG